MYTYTHTHTVVCKQLLVPQLKKYLASKEGKNYSGYFCFLKCPRSRLSPIKYLINTAAQEEQNFSVKLEQYLQAPKD